MREIVFIKTSSLGDVVHHMPAMTDARRALPEARLVWIVEDSFAPLARLHPAVNEVIPVATRRWRSHLFELATWREAASFRIDLRERAVDTVVDTQGLLRTALIGRLIEAERHGYDKDSIREPLASRFYDITHSVSRALHAVTRNRTLSALSLGYEIGDVIDYGLPLPDSVAGQQPYAVLLHGTSRVEKEWRESEWIGLGQALACRGLEVVLPWGNERERLRCERLHTAIRGSRILPRETLDVTAQVIARAKLVVGVDTGLLHLAAAYKVPLIGIYLATEPGLTGPVGAGPITILGGKGAAPAFAQAIEAAEKLLGA